MFKWQPHRPNESHQQDQNQQTWPSAASTSAPTKEMRPEQPIKSGLWWKWTNMNWKWIPQPGWAGHKNKRSAGQLRMVCRDPDEIPTTPQWAIVDWWLEGEHFEDISRLQWGENTEYEFAKNVEAPRWSSKPPQCSIIRRDVGTTRDIVDKSYSRIHRPIKSSSTHSRDTPPHTHTHTRQQ